MSSELKMVVGLGNPGPKYARNRHNIGFQCLDLFASKHAIDMGKMQYRARTGDGWVQRTTMSPAALTTSERQRVLLVKPLTYMNASGEAVGPLARYYQVDIENILVIHDDLDLEMGKLRLRRNGSSGGQNGIKSIIQHLGTQDFHRARIGIGRPPGRMDPAAFVLQDFTASEEELFGPLRQTVVAAVECWLFSGIEVAMNQFNG